MKDQQCEGVAHPRKGHGLNFEGYGIENRGRHRLSLHFCHML